MILDHIRNAKFYYPLSPHIRTGLEFLQNRKDLINLPIGKIEIDGANVFALVQEYKTKPFEQDKWEAHKKYFDIQFMVKGVEHIKISKNSDMKFLTDYNIEDDYQLFIGDGKSIKLNKDYFILLSPDDIHQPGLLVDKIPMPIKKLVIKVKIKS